MQEQINENLKKNRDLETHHFHAGVRRHRQLG